MKGKYLLIGALTFLFACSSQIESSVYSEFQKKGNDISGKTQSTLLKNVGLAIQKGGPQHAVEFCNLQASSIIDSLNQQFNCSILRITEKNRNPKAIVSGEIEKELWRIFKEGTLADTIISNTNKLVFYKPIKIGMPACLKCHGNTGSDINTATQEKITELYPKDLATGYALNDFRGLWKIEFVRE